MKKLFRIPLLLLLVLLACNSTHSQNLENPGDYMTAISNAHADMNRKFMAYMSAAAHSNRKRKVDKLRQQAVESINDSRYKTIDLPLYKGDNSLRQSSIDYIKLLYNVFNEDYTKIVNMEEIAEQSFDEMQAYLLLQQKTDEKIDEAVTKMKDASKAFADKYKVNIINSSSELSDKLKEAGKLNEYRNKIYLIFFKCNWQDQEIVKALNAGNLTQAEQGRSSLINYANEGLAALDGLKSFNGDNSLAGTCKEILQFYKKMAENDLPKLSDYFLKKENFEKMKKAFDKKSSPTKEDVNSFNDAVNDINKSLNAYNATNKSIHETRTSMINKWNEGERKFADEHMPYFRK